MHQALGWFVLRFGDPSQKSTEKTDRNESIHLTCIAKCELEKNEGDERDNQEIRVRRVGAESWKMGKQERRGRGRPLWGFSDRAR